MDVVLTKPYKCVPLASLPCPELTASPGLRSCWTFLANQSEAPVLYYAYV